MIARDRLEKSVGFVLYEVWMLRQCIRMELPNDRVRRNLWYEGLALHTRVLRDFFFLKLNKKGRPTARDDDDKLGDVLASHFFSDPTAWRYTSQDWTRYLVQNENRLDRSLAHLSYQRIEFEEKDKDWSRRDLEREIGGKWFEFLAKLGKAKEPAAAWFRNHRRARLVSFEPPF